MRAGKTRRWGAAAAAFVAAVTGAATAVPALAPSALATAQPRPNIVMVMVDDMREDDLRFMPWTRRLLGGKGVRFTNAFAPYPLCCPARASVLTGRYTHNHGVYDVDAPYAFPSFDDRSTMATWLRRSGYATIYIGKYLNGYGRMPRPGATTGTSVRYVPPGWTQWRASIDGGLSRSHPKDGGTYRFFDTTLTRDGKGFDNYQGRYQSTVYGDLTVNTIRKRAPSTKPFFLYVSYTAPHAGGPTERDDPKPVRRSDGVVEEFKTPARPDSVKGRFDSVIRQAPGASWTDPDFSDKPRYLRSSPVTSRAERRAMKEVARQRAESLWVVDRQVRRTVRALAAAGELKRTFVLFTSDNGFFLGEQRRRTGKVYPHEPSLRVPLLMRGPGIPGGQRRGDPFTSIDVAPTLAEAAGVAPPGPVDGISLLQVARRGDAGWTRGVLTAAGPRKPQRDTTLTGEPLTDGAQRDPRFLIGVRTPRYLYVDVATGEEELYDLRVDPRQYHNVVDHPDYLEPRQLLRAELAALRACSGDSCRKALPPELS